MPDIDNNSASLKNASNRIIDEMMAEPQYKYVNQDLLAAVVRETVSRYITIELEQED